MEQEEKLEDDENNKYWSNLEKIYVHDVYEQISSKYDELLRLSQTNLIQEKFSSIELEQIEIDGENFDDEVYSDDDEISVKKIHANKLRQALLRKNHGNNKLINAKCNSSDGATKKKCNLWPKVKKFLLELEPYSLIGKLFSFFKCFF
jgi:hypothetical protein